MHLPQHKGLWLAAALLLVAVSVAAGSRLIKTSPTAADLQESDQYTATGYAALQSARETGDPTYYGKADAAFVQALQLDPQNVDALIGKGTLQLARHQFSDALATGQAAKAISPPRALILGVIGDALIELGQYDQAVAAMQEMVNLRPDLSSYSRVSYARELYGDTSGAIALMQQALASGGGVPENVEWVRVQLGNLYFNKGDLTDAEREYQHALYDLPNYMYAQEGLGRVRAAQGRYAEAAGFFNKAINRVPLPQFVIELGETQQAAGDLAGAKQQYGLVRVENQLFKANGVNVDMELALFEADHGDPAQAVADARTAYAERPSVKAADTLAWALSQAGQQAEAQTMMAQALRLGTQDALFFYHAGMIAYRSGDTAGARARLGQALAVNPYFSPVYAREAQRVLAEAATR